MTEVLSPNNWFFKIVFSTSKLCQHHNAFVLFEWKQMSESSVFAALCRKRNDVTEFGEYFSIFLHSIKTLSKCINNKMMQSNKMFMLISVVLYTYWVLKILLQYLMVNLCLKPKSILTDLFILDTSIKIIYFTNGYCLIFIKNTLIH